MAVTAGKVANAETDLHTVEEIANGASNAPDVVNRAGGHLKTLARVLAELEASADAILAQRGYEPPVAFGAGINIIRPSQTVLRNDLIYAPIITELPFVTTAVFDVSQWYLVSARFGVSSVAALKNVAAVDGESMYLADPEERGSFRFSGIDMSAAVATDPTEIIYKTTAADDLAGTPGLHGAWVRQFDGNIHADWARAKGDGVTDDTAPLDALVDLAQLIGRGIELTPGRTYKLTTWATKITTAVLKIVGNGATLLGPGSLAFVKPEARVDFEDVTFDTWSSGLNADNRAADISGSRLARVRLINGDSVQINIEAKCLGYLIDDVVIEDIIGPSAAGVHIGWNDFFSADNNWQGVIRNIKIDGITQTTATSTSGWGLLIYGFSTLIEKPDIRNVSVVGLAAGDGAWGIYLKCRDSMVTDPYIEEIDATNAGDIIGINLKGGPKVNNRGNWATATVYAEKDYILQAGVYYYADQPHTSGVFATDLAAGKWAPLTPRGDNTHVRGGTIRKVGVNGTRGAAARIQSDDQSFIGTVMEDIGTAGVAMNAGGKAPQRPKVNGCTFIGSNVVGQIGIDANSSLAGDVLNDYEFCDNIFKNVRNCIRTLGAGDYRNIKVEGNTAEGSGGTDSFFTISGTSNYTGFSLRANKLRGSMLFGFWNQVGGTKTGFQIHDNDFDAASSPFGGTIPQGIDMRHTVRKRTSTAATTTLINLTLADITLYEARTRTVGKKTDGAQRAKYHKEALAYRSGGVATLQGAVQTIGTDIETDATWSADIAVGSNDLRFRVLGGAFDVDWAVELHVISV